MSPTDEQTSTDPTTSSQRTANRRDLVTRGALTLSAAALAAGLPAGCARADDLQATTETQASGPSGASLYQRLGGIFAIAGVVDYFSDEIIKDRIAGAHSRNPALRQWHTAQLGRLPGLKFMRTLWVAAVSGGPYEYTPTRPGSTNLGLEEAHRNLRTSSEEFDAVAGVLSRSLDHFNVPEREKSEVLSAFGAHKAEVTQGSRSAR